MVTKKIVTLSILSLVLFCGAIDAASAKYPTHSNNVFGRLSESLSDAIQHPVQAVQEVKRFAAAPFSKWFGGYDEQEQYHERMEDSWGNRNFDFMFSSEVDERDPNHPKYHVDIDIDVEKPSYLEIMRQVTESMYEGGDKYVTQKVVVTEKIPARDRYGRGIEEVRSSKIEEPEEEGEESSRRYLRSEGYGTHEKPRYKEHARQGDEESWTDSLKQKGHEIKEDVKEAAKKVAEKAERPLRETAERVKEGVKEGLETAEEKIEDFGDKLKEAEERVVETGEDIRRGLGETLKGVGRKIIGAEEKVRHGFEDKLEDVEDSLKDTARAFTDKAHKLKDKTQHIGHKFTDAVHNVEDKAKSTLQNVENMANQIRQNVEDNARGLASMLYYPVKEFKQWLTGGAKSVGEFVNKETNTVKRTAHEMKNAIARQGEKIKIPPISEKLCDAGQSLLDSVCGGRHASSEKEYAGHHEQYGSYGTASKHWDREPQQEGRRYHGFVEEEEPSYGRKHGHSDQVEEEICRPVYARTL